MKQTTKSVWKSAGLRLVAGLALLVILGSLLASCGGSANTRTIDNCNYNEDKNNLTRDELNELATLIVNKSDKNVSPFTLREMFTAAYLGYDLTNASREDDAAGKVPKIEADTVAETDAETATDAATETDVATDTDAATEADAATETDAASDTAETTTAAVAKRTKPDVSPEMEKAMTATVLKALKKFSIDTAKYESMNLTDMFSIMEAMEQKVEINSGRGFIGSIMYYIGVALRWVTNTIGFGSYIVGLLYFAIVIELLMLPFSIKQQKNSIRQAKLRPKEMAIRNKYKGRNDDVTRRKIQEETQALYQKENFNPLSGCLPLLLQLPIIYVLYYVVIDPLQYMLGGSSNLSSVLSSFYTTAKAAGGYGGTLQSSRGTIEVLSQLDVSNLGGLKDFLYFNPQTCADASETLGKICKDVPNFSVGGLNFGMTPSFTNPSLLLIVPVLTFAVYFLSMKITRKMSYQPIGNDDPGMGCSGKMMDYTMPLMSVWISFIVPAVVGIYWIFKSIVGTVKTVILSKVMPLPKFTEEDYKAAERALAGKAPAKREGGGSTRSDGDRPRSLHHIDDDDDLLPSGARERRKEPYREEDEETGEIAGEASKEELTADDKRAKDMIEGATLKDDGADAEKNGKKEEKKKNQ